MSIQKILKSLASATIATALFATVFTATPAAADDAIILPANANGVNNSGIQIYACPSHLEVYAPAPVNQVDPLSNREAAQFGQFQWRLYFDGSDVSSTEPSYDGVVQSQTLVYSPDVAFTSGEVVEFTLNASISNGPVAYTPVDIDLTATVVDPTFTQGSGTITDPYIV